MAFHSLSDFVDLLKKENELVEIALPISPHLEMTEITDRVTKANGPALLFTHPAGYEMPVLLNAFGSKKRMALALGVQHIDEIANRIRHLIQQKPPETFRQKLAALFQLKEITQFFPKKVGYGRCKEQIFTKDATLDILPILTCWPMDGGPFITLPLVHTQDPITGIRNMGMYRIQKFDALTTGMHWQIHKVGAAHYREFFKENRRMDVAVTLGGDPALTYAATAPLPPNIDEMLFAGFLRRTPVELVKCETCDLYVPADSEIVIEGYIDPMEQRMEGPFGDHTGYYSLAEPYPVFHVTCITMAKNPIYPATIVGIPPQEDAWLGKATERIFMPLIQMTFPEVVDMNLPVEGGFHSVALVSINKAYPGHAFKVAHAIWGTGMLSLTKNIIVVDGHVNVQNPAEVLWRVGNNVAPERDVQFVKGPVDALDNSSESLRFGSKMVIDATSKLPEEGFTRQWPPDISMTAEVKTKIDSLWDQLGLPLSLAESKKRLFTINPADKKE
ncbi:MAG: menaquinone biosynthesis decarboxylase [bacterium]|nr:menaquinone biosynthesis decarboxylase [bacterium]